MNKSLLVLAIALVIPANLAIPPVAHAVLVAISPAPAPNVANYTSYTFVIDPEGQSVTSIDARFFSPTMNQVNPMFMSTTFATVFEDNNGLFNSSTFGTTGLFPADDSQFEFRSNNDVNPEWNVTEFPGESVTPGLLKAVMSGPVAPLNSTFNLAHVVIPNTDIGTWMITTVVNNDPTTETPLSGTFGAVPEVSQIVMGFAALVCAVIIHKISSARRRPAEVCK